VYQLHFLGSDKKLYYTNHSSTSLDYLLLECEELGWQNNVGSNS